MNVNRRALNAYGQSDLEHQIDTASPHRLICLLYDGAIKAVAMAKVQMENHLVAAKGASISKAISIVEDGLRVALDKSVGGELADNLESLYDYISYRLLVANVNNDPEALDEVAKLLSELREAWESIGNAATQNNGASNESESPLELNREKKATLSYGRI
ncbi:flagellar export chaperone FliS [Parachitinimonas caeni]|uniref:Flagellar secretion chaperone FliS n=1 Tax=Parachitinimonas caeni TaxID=3031301 RepID=A0ABT7E273_9NEIS|nr:flagellar export chaperone FliS [Parachitinimonas caeni]MDK2126412.1 flagellar export chaperone FliS [Parachitinimonas caeni]